MSATQKMTYEDGYHDIAVVLPDRVLHVAAGDTVEVTPAEAKLLAPLPGWKAVKTTTKPESTKETT
jgi:hypothetical protein